MTGRVSSRWVVLAIVLAVATGGCSKHPEGFQTACTKAGTALFALDRGDTERAKEALESAYAWIEPAYEDTAGAAVAEQRALDRFTESVASARTDFGSQQSREFLVQAKSACE